jgi:hypothetical protein
VAIFQKLKASVFWNQTLLGHWKEYQLKYYGVQGRDGIEDELRIDDEDEDETEEDWAIEVEEDECDDIEDEEELADDVNRRTRARFN